MCLYKRAFEHVKAPGAQWPISIRMHKCLQTLRQEADYVTSGFANGSEATSELLIGADGLNAQVMKQV